MAEQPTNLSDYELQRLAHIRRNHEFLVSLGANSNLVIIVYGFFAMHVNRSLSAAEGRRVHPRADNDGAAEAPAPSSCTTPQDSES